MITTYRRYLKRFDEDDGTSTLNDMELREAYSECADEMRAIVDLAEKQDRELNECETTRFDELKSKVEKLEREIKTADERWQRDMDELDDTDWQAFFDARTTAREQGLDDPKPEDFRPGGNSFSGATGHEFRDQSGRTIRAYRHGERLARGGVRPGQVIRGLFVADEMPPEIRAQLSGVDTTGGYGLTNVVSGRFWDIARPRMVSERLGMQTMPILGDTTLIRGATDATNVWAAETQTVTASDVSIDAITLHPRKVSAIVPVSEELAMDASNFVSEVESMIGRAMAQAVDEAVLVGIGSANQPLGIRNAPNTNVQSSVGTPSDYSDITTAVQAILAANYNGEVSRLGWVTHSRDAATYDSLVDTTNQPLQPTPWASQLRTVSTSAIPTTEGAGSNESVQIIGDFSQVILGLRQGITVQVFNSGSVTDDAGTTWNAVSQFMRYLRVYMRLDIAIMRPSWFSVLTGVTA